MDGSAKAETAEYLPAKQLPTVGVAARTDLLLNARGPDARISVSCILICQTPFLPIATEPCWVSIFLCNALER